MKKLLTGVLLLASLSSQAFAASSTDIAKAISSWNGSPLPAQALVVPEVTIKDIVVQPGEKLPVHLHPVINAGVILEGELTVYTEDMKHKKTIKADTDNNTLVEMVNQYHFGKNEGDKPARIIVFYIGEKGETLTKLKK